MPERWSVSGLTAYLKRIVESDEPLQSLIVEGEIANFKKHAASGHVYFTLKDEKSALPAVWFNGNVLKHRGELPKSGDKVVVFGRIAVYEKEGRNQIYVTRMMRDGVGDFHEAFEALRRKLYAEGLVKTDEARRPLPTIPGRVALITSPNGAAARDFLRIAKSRWPQADILLIGATVQGKTGAASLIEALDYAYQQKDIDVIVVGRGGGSLEDLWNFNEESVVRKVYESPIPIVSAVGHEPDHVLTDLVADVRASTPSNAAERVFPLYSNVEEGLHNLERRMHHALHILLQNAESRLQERLARRIFSDPLSILYSYEERVDRTEEKIMQAAKLFYEKKAGVFTTRLATLEGLNPLGLMRRGFVRCEQDGCILQSVEDVDLTQELAVSFYDGTLYCQALRKEQRSIEHETLI